VCIYKKGDGHLGVVFLVHPRAAGDSAAAPRARALTSCGGGGCETGEARLLFSATTRGLFSPTHNTPHGLHSEKFIPPPNLAA
jgi:hypothetical protein